MHANGPVRHRGGNDLGPGLNHLRVQRLQNTAGEIKTNPVGPPADWNWQNFADAWTDADMGHGILNSGIIAVATAVGVAIIASLAAYSMTRLDLPAPGVWLLWLLVSISLPIQLFLVPLVAWWSKLGLYDDSWPRHTSWTSGVWTGTSRRSRPGSAKRSPQPIRR
jgi:ABC-type glycerol-3-phosphate transport system permease component